MVTKVCENWGRELVTGRRGFITITNREGSGLGAGRRKEGCVQVSTESACSVANGHPQVYANNPAAVRLLLQLLLLLLSYRCFFTC